MSKAPHMPWFIDAYMADTAHLSMEESGCYMHILASMWRRDGTIPDDDKEIARICRMSKYHWLKIKPHLIPFLIFENGSISQKRLKKEWDFVRNFKQKQRENIMARWNKNKDLTDTTVYTKPIPNAYPHTHTHIKEEKKVTRARGALGFEKFWEAYPNKVGKGAAIKFWATATKKATAEEIIAGVERYKSSKPADRAWCNPSTFLSQERWLDKPQEVIKEYKPTTNGYKPSAVFNSYQAFPPAEKWVPPTPEEIARRDAAIKIMRSAAKRA